MLRSFIIFIAYCIFANYTSFSQNNEFVKKRDLINTPIIDIIPSEVIIEKDSSKFYVEHVLVLNRGTGTLTMTGITGSCYCSNGVIEKNDVKFLDTGILRLEINKEGLKDDEETIIYSVKSNAQNSPFYLKVRFLDKKSSKNTNEK